MSRLALMVSGILGAMAGMHGLEAREERRPINPKTDATPFRLSARKNSFHYDPCCTLVDVWFDGKKRPMDVIEYDAVEGWIEVIVKRRGKRNKNVTRKLVGDVEPVWRQSAPAAPVPTVVSDEKSVIEAARAKRERKAAKLAALASKKAVA